jgi:hypothetical protein
MHWRPFFPAPGIYMLWMHGDEVLCQVAKYEPCGATQRDCVRFLEANGKHGMTPFLKYVGYKLPQSSLLIGYTNHVLFPLAS